MMQTLTYWIDENTWREVEAMASELHVGGETIVNRALHAYLGKLKRAKLTEQLQRESAMTANESLKILHEFEVLR